MRKLLGCIEIRQTSYLNRYPLCFQHVPFVRLYYAWTICLNISHGSAFGFPRPRPGFFRLCPEKERIQERVQE